MACLVNWARTRDGLTPLTISAELATAAGLKLAADVRCDAFSHTPCGTPFTRAFRQAGYLTNQTTGYELGENIAYDTALGSPRTIMAAWLHSPDHRANILDPGYTDMGFGYLIRNRFLDTDNARLWANDFGSRTGG